MTFWSAVRYVHAATPVRIYFRAAMVALILLEIWLAAHGDASETATVSLVVIQMFAVSTGFRGHASRGYYDVLLPRFTRRKLALAHATAAAAPGALAWVAIAAVQVAGGRSARVLALSPSALTAFVLVSLVAWSVSVPLGPLTGGSLWLAGAVAAAVNGGAMKLAGLAHAGTSVTPAARLAVMMAFPPFLVGFPFEGAVLAALLGIGALFLCGACAYVSGASFPLREEVS